MGQGISVSEADGQAWVPQNFLALSAEQSSLDQAGVVLIPVPYDSTISFRSGTRDGPRAIIDASYGLEDYDGELDLDVSQVGIHTTAMVEPHMGGPDQMVERIHQAVTRYVQASKLVGVLGGEHSVSIGSVRAHLESYPDLSVLYLDAHPDLRSEYMGTPWGHASGARRIQEVCPLVLVGVRSLCQEERDYIRCQGIPTFFWPPMVPDEVPSTEIVDRLGPDVYISIDLDVFDPALMASVGTPEPGGMSWYQVIGLLRHVARSRRVVGFDVCELSPGDGPPACSYTAAKLVYKLIAYAAALNLTSQAPHNEAGTIDP